MIAVSPLQVALVGQVAMVTGAASGLGAAVARQLLAAGADVIANYRADYGSLDDLHAAADAAGRRLMIVQGDIANDADCRAMATAAGQWSRVDILVNNAGTTRHIAHADLEAMASADFRHILEVNVVGAFQMTRAMLPLMRAAHEHAGTARPVVMISSVAGVLANGSSIAYAASKAALNNMTIALARALAPAIRVNAICPGYIDTPWFEKGTNSEQAAHVRDMVVTHMPLRTCPSPDDMAQTVLMLCSDATAHMTGMHLIVDDGLSLLPKT
jgi:3-oxoacyl-[acyl-carrier protein] reductase